MSSITRQQQANIAVDACNTCAFTVNLSTNSLIHHFRYNSRPSENRFSDGLLFLFRLIFQLRAQILQTLQYFVPCFV